MNNLVVKIKEPFLGMSRPKCKQDKQDKQDKYTPWSKNVLEKNYVIKIVIFH